jgi:NADPH:quinone reductase-like Zn-dependent oxidoreductase
LIPDNIEDVSAAGVPVAYLTAQMTLSLAGFAKDKTVLSPAIGGSVGNAVTQLARAQRGETCHFNDDQSCEGAASTLCGFRRGDRPFRGEA